MAKSAGVTSSVTSGHYTTAQTVTLTTTEAEGEIYYTTDGTTPTDAGTKYTAPIVLATGTKTTLKAVTVADDKDDSEVLTLYIVIDEAYLAKIRRAVRRTTTDFDDELTDIIAECRADLQKIGVIPSKATDETDVLILGCVRSFARWKFGMSNDDAAANREEYMMQRDELRRSRDYCGYAITFNVTATAVAVADVLVKFNGESRYTDSSGQAVFYYVAAGTNLPYTAEKTGYVSVEADLDVVATATVNVALTAG